MAEWLNLSPGTCSQEGKLLAAEEATFPNDCFAHMLEMEETLFLHLSSSSFHDALKIIFFWFRTNKEKKNLLPSLNIFPRSLKWESQYKLQSSRCSTKKQTSIQILTVHKWIDNSPHKPVHHTDPSISYESLQIWVISDLNSRKEPRPFWKIPC